MLAQLLANGLVTGCSYSLLALGFALIYFTTRTFHFAHGAVYTLSVYLLYTFFNLWKFPLWVAILIVLVISAIFGVLMDEILYVPLVKKGSSQLIQMLSSLGFYIIIINFIAMLYGNETKILLAGVQPTYHFGSIIYTRTQLLILITTAVLVPSFLLFLKKSKVGMMIRAMRDNPILLQSLGVSPRQVRWFAFAFGSVLAAVASSLNGLDVGIDPNIGMPALLNGVVAVIIGGVGFFEGPVLGGLLLGLLQSLVIWKTSARWQEMVTFIILILFLLFRPQGLLGYKRRTEETGL